MAVPSCKRMFYCKLGKLSYFVSTYQTLNIGGYRFVFNDYGCFFFVEISEITGIFSSAIHSFLMLPVSCNKRAQSVLWLRFF